MRSSLQGAVLLVALAARAGADEVDAAFFAGYHIFGASGPSDPDAGSVIGARGAYVLDPIALELEAAVIPAHARDTDDGLVTGFAYRLSLLVRLLPELAAVGGVSGLTLRWDTRFAAELGVAAEFDVSPSWGIRIDGRAFVGSDLDWEGTVSVTWKVFSR